MTLESIYYIGQMLAVIAILASLLAIYYQIRQTNRISRYNSTNSLIGQFDRLGVLLVTHRDLRLVLNKAKPLSEEETVQVDIFVNMYCNSWIMVQIAFDSGELSLGVYEAGVQDVQVEIERWRNFGPAVKIWMANFPVLAALPIFDFARNLKVSEPDK
jgi:hypothetical protein